MIAVVGFWCFSCFSFYLIGFYVKYFPGNVFVNFAMIGFADAFANLMNRSLQAYFNTKQVYRILLIGLTIMSASFFFTVDSGYITNFMAIASMIFAMRLFINGCFALSYYTNCQLFPTLLRSKVFTTTNAFARPCSMMSPLIAEYV